MPDNLNNSESTYGLSNTPTIGVDISGYGLTTEQNPTTGSPLIQPLDAATPSVAVGVTPIVNPGVFTVGSSGKVSIDYLFDGGADEGELAIFNLRGLDQFGVGTPAYIQEAARRASENSADGGYIVIRDRTEGAKFEGDVGYEGNFNSGPYLGVKTFNLQPGSQFGVMLVPQATVADVLSNSPNASGDNSPLFSIPTANPNSSLQFVQVPKLNLNNQSTGDGVIFSFEDKQPFKGSDSDYNDLVFQVAGATGGATSLDTVINPDKDWRNTTVGQQVRSATLQSVGSSTNVTKAQISKAMWKNSQL